jgi:hypothetical protein
MFHTELMDLFSKGIIYLSKTKFVHTADTKAHHHVGHVQDLSSLNFLTNKDDF